MPKCLCGKEMEFVMNGKDGKQLYKCKCDNTSSRVMVRSTAVPGMRMYYKYERTTWPEDKIDEPIPAPVEPDKSH